MPNTVLATGVCAHIMNSMYARAHADADHGPSRTHIMNSTYARAHTSTRGMSACIASFTAHNTLLAHITLSTIYVVGFVLIVVRGYNEYGDQ